MRVLFILAVTAMLAPAQSHPSWWTWASPDATALIGIHWEAVRSSPLASALADEVGPGGNLGMPELPCLNDSKQLLLSSPAFLVVASGDFPLDRLRSEAARQSMKAVSYKGVDVWISPGKETLSLARIGDHLLLLGFLRNLQAAIDRNQAQLNPPPANPQQANASPANSAPAERHYSPLLRRAARFADQDLWVVATELPDPLASLFVPLDVEARGFEGSVNLNDGIRLEGTLEAGSQEEASTIAAKVRQAAPALPSIARGLQAVEAGDMVVLAMVASREQVAASLRVPAPAAAANTGAASPQVPATAKVEAAAPKVEATAQPAPVPDPAVRRADSAPLAAASAPAPAPPGPRVVRIYGLDDGPREIVLPPLAR